MGILTDVRKTIAYAGRNGIKDTFYAARERLRERSGEGYTYEAPTAEQLQQQRDLYAAYVRSNSTKELPLISILVPLYQPNPQFMRDMIESVLLQTFGNYELILADGTFEGAAEVDPAEIAASYRDKRIKYHRLPQNGGISWNTNAAADYAIGDYIALLDYDDLLTPDAICEMTQMILREHPEILYSDEDKCDETGERFSEPNIKPDFNADYLLTNNYICHFLVMKTELFKALRLRPEYDGAQDYDLLLRAPWSCIAHVPLVLYHWRTHSGSTAGNPGNKDYAYEAGKKALMEHFRTCNINATVEESRHRGFFSVTYHPDIFACRPEVGIVGGKIVDKNRHIIGGMMDYNGNVAFLGMHEMESGPMHRADTMQDALAVDVRCMEICDALRPLYQEVMGAPYETHVMMSKGSNELMLLSIDFCRQAAQKGYLIVFDPTMVREIS